MQINSNQARVFYEQEAIKNNWSVRELERQVGGLLYERLAKSKDQEGLMRLVQKGQEIEKAELKKEVKHIKQRMYTNTLNTNGKQS